MYLPIIKKIKWSLSLFISVLFLTATQSAFAVDPDQYESDNSAANATVIQAGVIQVHTIHVIGDEDWVKFSVQATENIELKTSGLNAGTEISLYDSNLTFIDRDFGFSGHALLRVSKLQPGTYFAKVQDQGNNSEKSDFNLLLTTTVGNGDSFEADNIHSEASLGTPGMLQDRSIKPANDEDWIKFTLTATDNIELKTTGLVGGTEISVYDSNLTFIDRDFGFSGHALLRVSELQAGTYFAKVNDQSKNNEIDVYKFSLKTTISNGDQFEPDNILTDAINIFPSSTQAHSIVPGNDSDWVKFTLTAIDDIELKATGISGSNRIQLYNSELEKIEEVHSFSTQIVLNKTGLNPGVYYAVFFNTGNKEIPLYNLKITASFIASPPAKPSTPSASDGTYTDKIRINWNGVSGANYYEVYRCANTSVASCGIKFSDTNSPYNDTSAAAGVNYYFRVKACNNIGCSEFSKSNVGFRNDVGLTSKQEGGILSIIQLFLMDDD